MDLRLALAERGLECQLLAKPDCAPQNQGVDQPPPDFPTLMCAELKELLLATYHKQITPAHVKYQTWAVTLREIESPHTVVGCSTLSFAFDMPSYFHTAFEAIHPEHRRTGLGRILYDCIKVWTRFLILNDMLVLDGIIRSSGDYCLVSTIDRDDAVDDSDDEADDNEEGHGAFLKKLGFVRALHDFRQDTETEIAFQIAFHVPVVCTEEGGENPAEPVAPEPHPPLFRTLSSQ
jgi:hypothetical protein